MATAPSPFLEPQDRTALQVVQDHRAQAARLSEIVSKQMQQLHDAITNDAQLRAEIRALTAEDRAGRRRAALLKRFDRAAHARQLVVLAGALQQVIQVERQAYGLGSSELPAELAEVKSTTAMRNPDPAETERVFDEIRGKARERVRAYKETLARRQPAH